MNTSKNKDSKTKSQLLHELGEATNSIKVLKSDLNDCRKNLEHTQNKIAKLEEMESSTPTKADDVEQLQVELKNSKQQYNEMKENFDQIKQSNQKIEEENEHLKKKLESIIGSDTNGGLETGEDVSESSDEGQNLENDSLTFPLPYLPANEKEDTVKSDSRESDIRKEETVFPEIQKNDTKFQVRSKVSKHIIDTVQLKQLNDTPENDNEINAYDQFCIHAKINLPVMPSIENTDIDTPTYGFRVVVSEIPSNKQKLIKDVAHDLVFGVTKYDNVVDMPALEPGTYNMSFYTIVPFIHAAEEKNISFIVKG